MSERPKCPNCDSPNPISNGFCWRCRKCGKQYTKKVFRQERSQNIKRALLKELKALLNTSPDFTKLAIYVRRFDSENVKEIESRPNAVNGIRDLIRLVKEKIVQLEKEIGE